MIIVSLLVLLKLKKSDVIFKKCHFQRGITRNNKCRGAKRRWKGVNGQCKGDEWWRIGVQVWLGVLKGGGEALKSDEEAVKSDVDALKRDWVR